ncbi:MAG: hypothetical protein M1822_007161 [Bathelium mastoideum]|nr:MAG: hypothetical protein M1822_007161 [Bathelium mastoideum]
MAHGQQDSSFDYIICGGGTAGCVIAARLAENPEISVLLLEAGGSKDEVPASSIPAALADYVGTEADWKIKGEPCAQLNNRQLDLTRGKFLGGSSGANGTLCVRGIPQDYDDWNIEGWSGEDMFKYMSKAENFHDKSWFIPVDVAHGHNGRLATAPHDTAPISDCVLESYQSKGLPLVPDLFTTGNTPHGCGHVVRTVYQGIRTTSADFLDDPPDNLKVITKVYVDRVVFEEGNKPRASGVRIKSADGEEALFRARREVILTGGAYGSPAMLLRSGIGPAKELQDVGIKTQVNLPGVGKNLMDHIVLMTFYEVSKPGLTNDSQLYYPGAAEKSMARYHADHTGFMSQFPFGTFAFARLDDRLADSPIWQEASRAQPYGRDAMGLTSSQPHVEFWNMECYGPPQTYRDFPGDGQSAFAMVTELFSAQSRGEVTLDSPDPTKNPVVDHNYLSDPLGLDMLVLSEACQLANEIIMEGVGTRNVIKGAWPKQLTHHTHKSRDAWVSNIRQRADTCYHPAGTCKMGKENDPMAVLDNQLRVRGVEGLRVADASIMPKLMCGHPQIAVYGIAEKTADMIKEAL